MQRNIEVSKKLIFIVFYKSLYLLEIYLSLLNIVFFIFKFFLQISTFTRDILISTNYRAFKRELNFDRVVVVVIVLCCTIVKKQKVYFSPPSSLNNKITVCCFIVMISYQYNIFNFVIVQGFFQVYYCSQVFYPIQFFGHNKVKHSQMILSKTTHSIVNTKNTK